MFSCTKKRIEKKNCTTAMQPKIKNECRLGLKKECVECEIMGIESSKKRVKWGIADVRLNFVIKIEKESNMYVIVCRFIHSPSVFYF